MIELPLVFVAGILGTAHCLGMCGTFALLIGGGSQTWSRAAARQTSYTTGRVFTYAVLGAGAGYGGSRLAAILPGFVNIPATLAIVAGVLIYEHSLVRPDDLSRVNRAFFDLNGIVSLVYLAAVLAARPWSAS